MTSEAAVVVGHARLLSISTRKLCFFIASFSAIVMFVKDFGFGEFISLNFLLFTS